MEKYLERLECIKYTQNLDPLYEHLKSNNIELMHFAYRWYNNYLLRELPIGSIIRFWDTYLSEDDGFEIYHIFLCIAFLSWWSQDLMEMDFQQMLLFLQNPPNSWTHKDEEYLLSKA